MLFSLRKRLYDKIYDNPTIISNMNSKKSLEVFGNSFSKKLLNFDLVFKIEEITSKEYELLELCEDDLNIFFNFRWASIENSWENSKRKEKPLLSQKIKIIEKEEKYIFEAKIYKHNYLKCPRCFNLTSEIENHLCSSCDSYVEKHLLNSSINEH